MKKKFLPARLVSKGKRWYITFYQVDPISGIRQKFNRSYDLNRIRDKRLRKRRAVELVAELNMELLPFGYPFVKVDEKVPTILSLQEGLDVALEIKARSDRESTNRMYRSCHRIFLEWAKTVGILNIPVPEFKKSQAYRFMDYVRKERGVSGKTYNNYIIQLRALFYALLEREHVNDNPFVGIKKVTETNKQRRGLSEQEKKALIAWMKENDHTLLLAVVLMYYCGLRPVEILRLRLKNFNISKGVITLPGSITKNKKSSVVTIADEAMPFLMSCKFHHFPLNHLIFGKGLRPHPTIPAGTHSLRYRHKRAVKALIKKGAIVEDTGISLYSWKDTGVMDLAGKNVNILTIQNHLRHQDLNVTQRYTTSFDKTEEDIKTVRLRLLE